MLALLPLLAVAGAVLGADAGERPLTAWEEYLSRHPGAADDDTIGPLERRVLHALTPEQAEAFFDGAAPEEIVLAGGQTLAEFLLDSVGGGPGLVYVPRDQCLLFRTFAQTAPVTGPMSANEVRQFVARGSGTAHTDQGGVGGCLIPDEAVAVLMHFRVAAASGAGNGFLKAWRADLPEPSTSLLDYRPSGSAGFTTAAVIELCPLGGCASGEFQVKTVSLGGHVRGDVVGYFRPFETADVPGAGDADTLDGLDSTDFALATHTHDGGDITSGTVAEPFIDPLIARDDEVVDIVKDNDGAGSGIDADLLDGKQLTAFRPRPQNLILVATDGSGDFTTIGAALASISGESASNRFLVRVGPGTFNEPVAMKPFVDIEGKGTKATIISAPSQAGPAATVECADDAELRHLTVESTGGDEKAIAIRCLGTSPMLTHVRVLATGATGGTVPENIGILNDGAMPMLTGVHVDASPSPGLAVVNQNGAMPTIRDSDLAGADSAVENRDTATAKLAYTALAGGADVMAPAVQASYMCVRAYDAGTLGALNAECFPNTPPTATDDSYKTLGNVVLEVDLAAASGSPAVVGEDPAPLVYADVLDNDIDAEGGLTASAPAVTTLGGDLAMNPDGSFSYTPPVGVTGVTDDFDYTVTDSGGLTDTGTVQIEIQQRVWFVDDVNGSDATGDGRSDGPFASLAPLDAGGSAADGSGDTIFVFADDGATAGGILLETGQVLHGHEVALDFAGFNFAAGSVLVTASTAPTITDAAGDVVELVSGNTVRGLDIAATAGRAIFGNGSAGATIDRVGTTGTGTGTGVQFTGASGTISFADLDLNSSSNWGIVIQNSTGTFTFDSSCSITNPTGVAFSVESGAPTVTYSGTIANSSAQTINVSSTTGGTVLFDGSSINGDSSAGILLTSVGGNVTVDAGATTINNGSGTGISIQSASTGTFRFDDVTISNPSGAGIDINGGAGDALTGTVDFNNVDVTSGDVSGPVSIAGLGGGGVDFDAASAITSTNGGITITSNIGGTVGFNGPVTLITAGLPAVNGTSNAGATINFAGNLDIDTTSGTGFNMTGGGTVNVDSSTSSTTVDTATGIGVNIGAGIGATGVSFDTVNVNGASSGILLSNTGSGTFNVAAGTIQNTIGTSFGAANVDGPVMINASLENNGGRTVDITSSSAGSFTFSGAIDENAQGINISSNDAGASYTFQGGVAINTIGSNIGLRAFSGGTLNVCADTNCSAAGGTPVVNTVDTTAGTGTAVSIDLVTIGGEGVTFRSIDVDAGTGPGIRLDTTGAGAFTVTGIDGPCGQPGATDCDGGTLANLQGDAIQLENTDGPVSLSNMLIQDIGSTAGDFDTLSGHDAIHGQSVDGGLTLDNVTIRRISDMAINGTLFNPMGGDPTTVWNGLTITDSHIANTNRFDPALPAVADDSGEGGVRILGLRGTTLLDGNIFERGGTLVQLFVTSGAGPLPATTTITVTENDFKDAYKEFATGGVFSKGITCLDVIAQATGNVDLTVGSRATTTVGHQAGDDGNLFLNCHGASLRYGNDSTTVFGLPAATGDVDGDVGNNTFRSTDHDSAPPRMVMGVLVTPDFDFPRGYLLAITRGTDAATLDTRIAYNLFDEVSFEGGLGQLNLDFEDGVHQAKIDFNTFDSPGHQPWFVRADSSASARVLFRDNTGIRGPFCSEDPSAAGGGCDLGGGNLCAGVNPSNEGYCGPGESAIAQVQNLGDLDMGIIDDTFALEDAYYTIGETVRVRTVNTGGSGTICAYLEDNTSPNGYGLQEDAGTLELEQGASASTDPATVLADNNNTGTPKNILGGVTVTTGTCDRPTGSLFN